MHAKLTRYALIEGEVGDGTVESGSVELDNKDGSAIPYRFEEIDLNGEMA